MSRYMSLETCWWWIVPVVALSLLVPTSDVLAAGTPAGTVIRNVATANYKDASGNDLPAVRSNEVATVVSQIAGVDLSPGDEAQNLTAGGTAFFHAHVANIGNGEDVFDLTISGVPAGWTAVIYQDLNDNGILDPEEIAPDNTITSPSLQADEFVPFIMQVTTPAGTADGQVATISVTATSRFDGDVTDVGAYVATVTAAALQIVKTATPENPRVGEVVTYVIRGANEGTATGFDVVVTDPLPSGVTYLPGSIRYGEGRDITYDAAVPLTDASDGDPADFGISAPNTVSVRWGDSPGGQVGSVFFRVTVNTGLPAGTEVHNVANVAYESPSGTAAPPVTSAPGSFNVTASANPLLAITSSAGTGESGSTVSYPITVTNGSNGTDVLDITTTSSAGFPNQIWVDANGDGIPGNDGDYLLTDTDGDGKPDTGSLESGASVKLIAVVSIPAGTADETVDLTTISVTSSSDPTVSASSTLTTTAYAPEISVLKSVSPEGAQAPGQVLTYVSTVSNVGHGTATTLVLQDHIPINTTYVPNSVTVDGHDHTDAADGDNVVVTNGNVVVNVGTLGPGGSHTIRFSVTIN